MEDFNQYFHYSDIWKALFAMCSGLILGYEREMKDKSAGIKTISIISVGSALYAILSQNFSGEGDNFAIAAGIITGIGFLGAGVIFKEGFTIYGLTTAGVIWVSAAIGMSIGFGEFYIALVFLVTTLLIVYGTQVMGKFFVPKNFNKSLEVVLDEYSSDSHWKLLDEIKIFTMFQVLTQTTKIDDNTVKILIDIHISDQQKRELEAYLFSRKDIKSFII